MDQRMLALYVKFKAEELLSSEESHAASSVESSGQRMSGLGRRGAMTPASALRRIRDVLPDIDEGHARNWCKEHAKCAESVEEFVGQCLEMGYPRAPAAHPGPATEAGSSAWRSAQEEADRLDWRQEVERRWQAELRGEEPPPPLVTAGAKARTANYNLHAMHTLLVQFAQVPKADVRKAFLKLGSFTAAATQLQERAGQQLRRARKASLPPPPCEIPQDLIFEIAFQSYARKIEQALSERRREREAKVEQLQRIGGLNTCACCFDDALLEDETLFCNSGEAHTFCIGCVKNAALSFFSTGLFALNFHEAARGSALSSSAESPEARKAESSSANHKVMGSRDVRLATVRCPHTSGCIGSFNDASLQRALPPKEYKRYSSRAAALHAIASGLRGLAPCPACDFMVEMGEDTESVVRCLSEDCGKVSCRRCGEDDHRPLSCEEVEKDSQVRLRTFLEEQMMDASTRRCPNPVCRKPYEKVEGCNKMKCSCGTCMCYLCGVVLDSARPYDHFRDGAQGGGTNAEASQCTVYGEPTWAKRSAQAVRSKTEAALQEYLRAHPELQGLGGEQMRQVRRHAGLDEEAPTEAGSAPPLRKRHRAVQAHDEDVCSSIFYGSGCDIQ